MRRGYQKIVIRRASASNYSRQLWQTLESTVEHNVQILRESIPMLAYESTWRRPGSIEAGKSHENHIQVASRHVFLYFFVLNFGEAIH